MRAFLHDRIVQLGLLIALAYVLLYTVPILSTAQREGFSEHWAEPILLALLVIGLFHGLRRTNHTEERRFWGLLGACFGLWLFGTLLNSIVWFRPSEYWLEMGVDSLFLLSYLACFVALDQRPHLESGWSSKDPTYAFSALGTLLFVFALIVYFFIFPYVLRGGYSAGAIPTAIPYIAFDALLAIRFFHLVWACSDHWWRRAYMVLGLASVFWIVTDSLEWMISQGLTELDYGTALDALWYVPFFAIFFVRRSRRFNAAPTLGPPQRSNGVLPVSEGQADAAVLLLIYAFLFPVFHLTLNTLGLLEPAGRASREALVLFSLLSFVALAVGQQRLLAVRNRELRSAITVLVSHEQMQQAQKMEAIGRLAGGVAHDFNNLLTVIQGNCSLVKDRLNDGRLRRYTDEILKAADRASWLTRQLLAFSRGQVLRPKTVNVATVVRDAETMLRRLLGEKIEVRTRYGTGPALVKVDAGQLVQVILNLAVNARDAMPDGGCLTLRVSTETLTEPDTETLPPARPGSYVVLTARDTGCGMDEETRAQVFEPFFTGKHGGVGLGLATVYGIVVQSGGFIRVSSKEQVGTTFRIHLPAAEVEAEAAETPPQQPPTATVGRRATVLVVEDDETVRQTVCGLLDACGLDVIDAERGEEALELFKESGDRIDLLLTDIVMPGMSGWELAEEIRRVKPEIKVIYASGYSKSEMGEHHALGRDDVFLQKPFNMVELRASLEAMLGPRDKAAGVRVPSSVT